MFSYMCREHVWKLTAVIVCGEREIYDKEGETGGTQATKVCVCMCMHATYINKRNIESSPKVFTAILSVL